MAKSSDKISIGQNYEIQKPCTESAVLVSVGQWMQLMNRVKASQDDSHFYDSIGWSAISAAVTATFTAIAFPFSVSFSAKAPDGTVSVAGGIVACQVVMCSVAIAGYIAGGVALRFASDKRRIYKQNRDWLAEDMQLIASRYVPQAAASNIAAGTEVAEHPISAPATGDKMSSSEAA